MNVRKIFSALSALLVVTGIVQGVRGGWMIAKAHLSQVLLSHSWERAREGGGEVKPWPWADSWPVASLSFPDGTSYVVLAGASGRNLAFAPGQLDGTAEPGGGGTCVITGHRDTHFKHLDRLAVGQILKLEDSEKRLHEYRVVGAAVVDQRDTWVVTENDDRTLVLITCWPLDSPTAGGRLRYVVWAELEPKDSNSRS